MRVIATALLLFAGAPALAFPIAAPITNDPCLDWLALTRHQPAAGMVYGDCLKRAVADPSIKIADPYIADVVEWLRAAKGR